MARRGFLWYIFSANKLPLYIDDNGFLLEGSADLLKPDGQPACLTYSPTGWKDTLVKYARNTTYWGLQRDLTVPMTFAGDGKKVLETLMWTFGYEGIAYLGISKFNRIDLPYKYEDWYLTELNFVRFKQAKSTVAIEALEGGMSKLFKAFESTDFEIPIDEDDEAVTILMDGIPLQMAQDYSYLDDFQWGSYEFYSIQFVNPIVRKQPDGLAPYVQLQDQFAEQAILDNNLYKYLVESENWMLRVTDDGPAAGVDINLNGRVDVTLLEQNVNNGLIMFRVWHVYKNDDWLSLQARGGLEIFKGYILNSTPKYKRFVDGVLLNEIVFNIDVNVKPGDRLFYTTEYYPTTSTQRSLYKFDATSTMNISYQTRFKETYIKGLYAHRVFEKLVAKIIDGAALLNTDNGLYYKSDWLKNKKDIVITSQDAIRGIPGAIMKTNIKAFFQSMNFFGAALGVEKEKLFIELFPYVFRDDIIIDLGEVLDAKLDVAEDLLFNTIKTGGKVIDYGDVNGRFEFNQEQKWATKNTKGVRELDISTPYRRDSYGAEYARINLEGKKTTDDKSDNDIWMLNVENTINFLPDGSPYKKLNRPPYTLFTGAPVGVFNTELTPHIGILNQGHLIHSILDIQDANLISLTSAEKNKDLITELTRRVAEAEPISIGNLLPKLFKPYYINFTTKVPINLLALMNEKPYGKVKFNVAGRPYYGYLMDGGVKPAMNDKQVWKVLSTADNNFINFYKPI